MPLDRKVVERFHQVLLEEIREDAPEYLNGPFTVAEIYQSLVPYRTHRDRIGVELNGDYEDALLRLLAGEGDFLRLDSDPARERIRREISSTNPNTGIYREFAAVSVRLNPERIPSSSLDEARNGRAEEGPRSEPALPLEDAPVEHPEEAGSTTGGHPGGESRSADDGPAAQPTPGDEGPVLTAAAVPDGNCPECEAPLPDRDALRYCPFCGVNVFVKPCDECGEVLERSWRFCVACGTRSGR
jgi:hypothetical protein